MIRATLSMTVKAGREEEFERAWRAIAAQRRLIPGNPGHIQDELLRADGEPGSYILLSEWESKGAFLAWEDAPIHMQTTTPMRPFWAGRVERKIYEVAFRLG